MSDLSSKDQVFVDRLTEIISSNLRNENFGVKELALESGISHYSLTLRIKSITGKTVTRFIRETRLQKALDILKNEDVPASEVAFRVGFSSPAYFNTCFHEYYGFPPGKIKTGEAGIPDIEIPDISGADPKQIKPVHKSVIFILSCVLIVIIVAVIAFSLPDGRMFRRSNLEKLLSSGKSITVAVMPFRHLTADSIRYGEIIQTILTNFLSGFAGELKVLQEESVNGILTSRGLTDLASITPILALDAATRIDADVYISGDIVKSGNIRRFYTEMTDARTKQVIKSFELVSLTEDENVLRIPDSISFQVENYLKISKLEKKNVEFAKVTTTSSAKAYTYYLNGKDAYYSMHYSDAIDWFKKALEADTNFIWAINFLGPANQNNGNMDETRKWTQILYSKKDMMNEYQKLHADYAYSNTFLTPNESIITLKKLLEIDDQPPVRRSLGAKYFNLQQYDKAIPELERALEIYKKWGSKPLGYDFYSFLAVSYHETGQYKKEKRLYRRSERDFPDNIYLTGRQAILALTEGDTVKAKKYIEKYISILKSNSASKASLAGNVGNLYREGRLPDNAEKYYRKALQLESGNLYWQNTLAIFLIDSGRNLNEGMELVGNILKADSANLRALRTKGWGLYKQGRSSEALDLLQKSWDTKLYGYNHLDFLRLEEVKRAVE
jgi:AraC-like DNA-binding protein/tetratricopeptide (TPR) repeat protein